MPELVNETDVRGKVKWFNLVKGFGFIEILSGENKGSDIYVHASDIRGDPLKEDDDVEFDIEEDDRRPGNKRASRVSGGTGNEEDRERAKGKSKGKGKYGDYDSYKGKDSYNKGKDSYGKGYGSKGYKDGKGGKGDESYENNKGQMRKGGDWDCEACGFMNFAARDRCMKCNALKPYGRGDGKGGKGGYSTSWKGYDDRDHTRSGRDDRGRGRSPRGGRGRSTRSRTPPRRKDSRRRAISPVDSRR